MAHPAKEISQREFSLGDVVEWTSQSAGISKTKRGKVIEVVPPRTKPVKRSKDIGRVRDHISYVISAKGVRPDGSLDKRSRRYWPKVQYLKLVEAV